MKNKLRILALGTFGSMAVLGGFLVACGDDGSTDSPNSGADSGNDARVDATTPASDSGDDGATDGGSDAADPLLTYSAQIEDALCTALAHCCFGNPNFPDGGGVDAGGLLPDGGGNILHYNKAACEKAAKNVGFEYSDVGVIADGGAVTVDPTKAADCVNKVANLNCDMGATELQATRALCFSAFTGSRALGDSCSTSAQCPASSFCKPNGQDGGTIDAGTGVTTDNGPGTCAPLATTGQSCNYFFNVGNLGDEITDSIKNEEACSTRGSGDTHLRCKSYDPAQTNGTYYFARSAWTCQPTVPADSDCNSTAWCSDGICDINNGFVCSSPSEYFGYQCSTNAYLQP